MDNHEELLKHTQVIMENALDHYRAVPNVHTWQKFHQRLKQYVQVFDEQETHKKFRYHEKIQKLSKCRSSLA